MKVVNLLKEEHNRLKIFHMYLNAAADRIEKGEKVTPTFFKKVAKFADLFIYRYHHHIEKNLILEFLKKKGFPEQEGIIHSIESDHQEASRYLSDLWEAVTTWERDLTASKKVVLNIRAYTRLIAAHVGEEEMVFFPLLLSVLSPEEDEALYLKVRSLISDLNNNLFQLYQDSIDELQTELGVDAIPEQEQLQRLWTLMQEGPEKIIDDISLFF